MDNSTSASTLHVALRVADLDAAVAFYSTLLGVEPSLRKDDYAKLEPAEPPVVLSLRVDESEGLDHFGIRMERPVDVKAQRDRLEAAGLPTKTEDAVSCCYSVQDKAWAQDPSGYAWELYAVKEAAEGLNCSHRGPSPENPSV